MQLKKPYLIIDLNDNKVIFFVVSFNEKKDFKVLKKIVIDSQGIQNGRVVDVEIVSQLLKKTVNEIEENINHFFSNAAVIINPNQVNCLNVSGYKRLNGAQVSNEDITYIFFYMGGADDLTAVIVPAKFLFFGSATSYTSTVIALSVFCYKYD